MTKLQLLKQLNHIADLLVLPTDLETCHSCSNIYKGHGSKLEASSHRPISICSYLGKMMRMEHIAHKQLIAHLNDNDLLCMDQHGFMLGRSTLTNFLSFDAHIVNYISSLNIHLISLLLTIIGA